MTRQGQEILIKYIETIQISDNGRINVDYTPFELNNKYAETEESVKHKSQILENRQLSLFQIYSRRISIIINKQVSSYVLGRRCSIWMYLFYRN